MTPDAREQARHKASVMIAFAEGKEIEHRYKAPNSKEWNSIAQPTWRWHDYDYRVKPEERKPREVKFWISDRVDNVYPEHYIINDTVGGGWRLATFVEKVLPETETE
jgi:hypothetical protein